jgi:hypothetical protein
MSHRVIAAALALLTGVLHVYQFFLSPPDAVSVGTTLFGFVFLALGAALALGSWRAAWVGTWLPIIGATIGLLSMPLYGNRLFPWVMLFGIIDAAIVWACRAALRTRGTT